MMTTLAPPEAGTTPGSLDHPREQLGRRVLRGGAVVFGAMLLQKLLGLLLLAIMARLLTPRDYGLMGMVLAVTAFLQIFSDAGLPLATIQKADLTHPQLSAMFWLNLGLGLLLGLGIFVLAPAVAWFFHEPQLRPVAGWLALSFPLTALGAQHGALLQRKMAFTRLMLTEMAGLLAGGAAGLLLAWQGYGIYALVAQVLATAAGTTLAAWLWAGWVPGARLRGTGLRETIRFSGYLTGYCLVNYFARNLDKVLLGRFSAAEQVGLYNRAYSLMFLPVSLVAVPAGRIMLPALSAVQHDRPRLRRLYLRYLQVIGFVTFPLMTLLALKAGWFIRLIYGPGWEGAVPLFQILCLSGLGQGIYSAAGYLFVAVGRTDRQFRAGLVVSLILAGSYLAGIPWGAQGVALAYTAGFLACLPVYLYYAYATVGLPLRSALKKLILPLFISILLALVLLLCDLRG